MPKGKKSKQMPIHRTHRGIIDELQRKEKTPLDEVTGKTQK